MKAELVASAIGAITESVGQAKSLVEEVSTASRQQADGITQVSQTVTQMERGTQDIAATAEETAATSEELQTEASKVREIVLQLEGMVGTVAQAATVDDLPARSAPPAVAPPTAVPARPTLVQAPRHSVPTEAADGTFGAF